jgi:hypothetical protein
MSGGVLIDQKGRLWPDNSWDLALRIGYKDPRSDIAGFAVRERGFVHIAPRDNAVRVTLRERRFSLVSFTGTMLELRRRKTAHIVLCVLGDGSNAPTYRIFTDLHDFCAEIESLAAGKPLEIRLPRLSELRSAKVLHLAPFAAARPMVQLWERTRGEFTDEVRRAVFSSVLLPRTVLVRKSASSSRLITEHVGSSIGVMNPCRALLTVGQDFSEHHPDRAYGAWVAESYAQTLWSRRIRVESVRAMINTEAAATFRTRYDRVLIPWYSRANDTFALALSIRRETPVRIS